MAKKIKVTTTSNAYKILVEYDPVTLITRIKIRHDDDIYKQLETSLHSLAVIKYIIDEDDPIQTISLFTGLSSLKTYLEDNDFRSPSIFTNGSFRLLRDKTIAELNKKGEI